MWEIWWVDSHGQTRNEIQEDVSDLDAVVDDLERRCARSGSHGAEIVSGVTGNILSIGIRADRAVLSSTGPGGLQPYHVSRSSAEAVETRRVVRFVILNEESEFWAHNVVPLDVARQTLRDFALTGVLPAHIAWEGV